MENGDGFPGSNVPGELLNTSQPTLLHSISHQFAFEHLTKNCKQWPRTRRVKKTSSIPKNLGQRTTIACNHWCSTSHSLNGRQAKTFQQFPLAFTHLKTPQHLPRRPNRAPEAGTVVIGVDGAAKKFSSSRTSRFS